MSVSRVVAVPDKNLCSNGLSVLKQVQRSAKSGFKVFGFELNEQTLIGITRTLNTEMKLQPVSLILEIKYLQSEFLIELLRRGETSDNENVTK